MVYLIKNGDMFKHFDSSCNNICITETLDDAHDCMYIPSIRLDNFKSNFRAFVAAFEDKNKDLRIGSDYHADLSDLVEIAEENTDLFKSCIIYDGGLNG